MMDPAPENINNPNYTYPSFPSVSKKYDNISEEVSSPNTSDIGAEVIYVADLVICVFGAVGNGMVIWLLGFRIKRNPFSTFILNLATADLGVLLSAILEISLYLLSSAFDSVVTLYLFLSMYSTSQFLLTAISIDRCVAVFFPLWHQCRRPPHLSTIVSALIWVLSFLLTAVTWVLRSGNPYVIRIEDSCQLIVNAVLCLPIMTVATVALFIKLCFKSRPHQRRRLLTIVLLTLLFFLLFAFPYNITYILSDHTYSALPMTSVTLLLSDLNSSVNPVIYFLVGRRWKSRRRENLKMILQKVFKEEEGCTEETPAETQL